jgi:hypothetical protein
MLSLDAEQPVGFRAQLMPTQVRALDYRKTFLVLKIRKESYRDGV